MNYKDKIRVIQDFPEKGIRFKDITTLLQDGAAFHAVIDELAQPFQKNDVDLVVGPEARGFTVGAPLAYVLNAGFVPIRKPGKLPGEVLHHEYKLEYGTDALEVHADAIKAGQKVLIVDDLLATGGTVQAVVKMVEQLGGEIVGIAFLIELSYLNGRSLLDKYNVMSLIEY